jgi:hypothetical protein
MQTLSPNELKLLGMRCALKSLFIPRNPSASSIINTFIFLDLQKASGNAGK